MRSLILISTFLLVSCQLKKETIKQPSTHFFTESNEIFDSYIEEFEDDCDVYDNFGNVTTKINIVDKIPEKKDTIIGTCYHFSNDYNEILIKKSYWISAGEMRRKQLIYHELGHCELERSHKDTSVELDRIRPLSIMKSNAFLIPRELWDDYVVELFTSDDEELMQALIDYVNND
jgi:hypothetical protein